MDQLNNEESEFKEFIEQINVLQQMQGTEQEELHLQRKINVDLMEDLLKDKRKLESEIGQYTRLNYRQAQLQKNNHEYQQQLDNLIRENEALLGKEIDLQHSLDTLKRKHQEELRFYGTHVARLDRLTRIKESYLASLECSHRLKKLQQQLSLTESNIATLIGEENALNLQLATSTSEFIDERALKSQDTELSAEVQRLSARVTKARGELQTAQARFNEISAMHHEDYNSTMYEVVQWDHESQQLESLLEKERMETEALKFELSEFDNQMFA